VEILIERLDHTGDCVETLPPLVEQIRRELPDASIDLLLLPRNEPLFRNLEGVRRVLSFEAPWIAPPPGLRYTPKPLYFSRSLRWLALVLRERMWRYDEVMFLCFSPWIRYYFSVLPGRRTGFDGPYEHARFKRSVRLLHRSVRFDTGAHLRTNCLRLGSAVLGVDLEEKTPAPLRIGEPWSGRAEALLTEAGIGASDFAIVHPSGPGSFKSWPHTRFMEVAEALARTVEVAVVLSPDVLAATDKLYPRSGHPRVRYLATADFAELAAVTANAALLVGNDGGPVHLAAAMGVPTVAVFGPTDERVYAPRGCTTVRVVARRSCAGACCRPWSMAPCARPCPCLEELDSAPVIHAARELLAAAS
jgi:ADP-heptose:LPS heptosyltransferase